MAAPLLHPARLRPAILVLALLLGACGITACSRPAPEEALRASFAELQGAIEQRDASAVEALLADDFIGPEGLDRQGAHRLAQATFLRFRDIAARFGPLDVALQGDTGRISGTAVVTDGAGLLPTQGQVYGFRTGWRLEGGDWRLVCALWNPQL